MRLLNIATNLVSAGVALVVSPVMIVADIVTLPGNACDPRRGAFDRTAGILKAAGACLDEAVKPSKE